MARHPASCPRRHHTRGGGYAFTLVELLVVISIIALLIAILLPSLKSAREQTRSLKCMANLRTMGQGLELYAQDHKDVLPGPLHPPVFRNTGGKPSDVSTSSTYEWPPLNPNTERPWFLLYRLAPYFSRFDNYLKFTDAVATCPTGEMKIPDDNFRPGVTPPGETEANQSYMRPYNYLINSWNTTAPTFYFGWINIGTTWTGWINGYDPTDDIFDPQNTSYQAPKPITMIKRASDEWALGDAWWKIKSDFHSPSDIRTKRLGTWQLGDSGPSRLPLPRKPYHGRGEITTNLVFFDGHGAPFRDWQNWTDYFPANRNVEFFPPTQGQ
jgi:prepilin-type N-terminal cleavage/methylation domain-containing protein